MRIAILDEYSPSNVLSEEEIARYGVSPGHPHPWVRNLAEGLARIEGNEVHVVSMTNELPGDLERERAGVTYHFVRSSLQWLKALTLLESNAWRVRALLRKLRIEIANAHGLSRASYFALRSGLPAVVTLHGLGMKNWLSMSGTPWIHGQLLLHYDRVCRKHMRYFIMVSAILRNQRHELCKNARVWVVENAIGAEYFQARPREQGRHFLFVGSLSERKSPADLLRAVESVPLARARLVFATRDPGYHETLIRYVAERGLKERVVFVGRLEPGRLAEELAGCCALVLPSHLETAPTVISEAFAVGTPVIATGVDGVPLMVRDGVTGFVFQPGDVAALAFHIRHLMQDPDLARRMGAAGRHEAVKRWHPDLIAAQTMDVYREVLAAG